MERVIAPKIEELDNLELHQVAEKLELAAPKYSLDCVNWEKDFPYHPITVFSIAHSSKYIYVNFFVRCNYQRAVNASHRKDRKHPTRLNEAEINSIKRIASCGKRPFQELEGLFNWSLLIAIPLELIGMDGAQMPVTIKGNFYKCASATSMPHYLSHFPIVSEKPNFHCPEFFGDIVLE